MLEGEPVGVHGGLLVLVVHVPDFKNLGLNFRIQTQQSEIIEFIAVCQREGLEDGEGDGLFVKPRGEEVLAICFHVGRHLGDVLPSIEERSPAGDSGGQGVVLVHRI